MVEDLKAIISKLSDHLHYFNKGLQTEHELERNTGEIIHFYLTNIKKYKGLKIKINKDK